MDTPACRYAGTDVAVMTLWQTDSDPAAAFAAAYQREFGFVLDRPVVVDDIRVRATGRAADLPQVTVLGAGDIPPLPAPALTSSTYFDGLGRTDTPVYMLDQLSGGQKLPGPALLIDNIRWGTRAVWILIIVHRCMLSMVNDVVRALVDLLLVPWCQLPAFSPCVAVVCAKHQLLLVVLMYACTAVPSSLSLGGWQPSQQTTMYAWMLAAMASNNCNSSSGNKKWCPSLQPLWAVIPFNCLSSHIGGV